MPMSAGWMLRFLCRWRRVHIRPRYKYVCKQHRMRDVDMPIHVMSIVNTIYNFFFFCPFSTSFYMRFLARNGNGDGIMRSNQSVWNIVAVDMILSLHINYCIICAHTLNDHHIYLCFVVVRALLALRPRFTVNDVETGYIHAVRKHTWTPNTCASTLL